ncbi:unnamed protein product [Prorocentrum cordatum]|uniref:Endonuclease/exonuclease/phosphatase domain-containing protein n=1 Tax=Prorocentrum cordatum TaxID=2364126 RepID=A0ABN9WUU4_9DINO|nr:unnamed protein product [Polarella glacialis]
MHVKRRRALQIVTWNVGRASPELIGEILNQVVRFFGSSVVVLLQEVQGWPEDPGTAGWSIRHKSGDYVAIAWPHTLALNSSFSHSSRHAMGTIFGSTCIACCYLPCGKDVAEFSEALKELESVRTWAFTHGVSSFLFGGDLNTTLPTDLGRITGKRGLAAPMKEEGRRRQDLLIDILDRWKLRLANTFGEPGAIQDIRTFSHLSQNTGSFLDFVAIPQAWGHRG